ncbi:M48 family metalloprotease [Sphingomonas montana]|uniref:M48 family metalloprotease n=1 Tax=Sphingomonas montana TaxID=1843236 RepID=UPI0009F9A9EC|nr:M48 family metalloprotease [Sphingomonas montana]
MRKHKLFQRATSQAIAGVLIVGVAIVSTGSPVYSQGFSDLLGSAKKIAHAATITDDQVVGYFSQMSDEMDRQNPIAPAKNPYAVRLTKLTTGLASYDGLKLDIKPYLVKDVNAFAMGDGTVRVYSGLMDKFSDDEVRCVIGHEIGHVKLEHGQNRLKRALRQDAALSVAGTASSGVRRIASSELGGLIQNVISAQYSQGAETASDDYALTFMTAKGYPQQACPAAMDKLAALGSGGGIGLLKTHPDPAQRAKRMRAKIR